MAKRKVLPETEIPNRKVEQKKTKGKKRKKKLKIDWSNMLRVAFLLFLTGMIVFHYYLSIENKLGSFYLSFWAHNKAALSPILIIIAYTLAAFFCGFWFGRRK